MILGQSAPTAASDTDLYTVPSKKIATVRILVCNRGSTQQDFRIAVRPGGAALANEHYIVYDRALAGGGTSHTVPIELAEDDVITVRAATNDFSFTATGVEEGELE